MILVNSTGAMPTCLYTLGHFVLGTHSVHQLVTRSGMVHEVNFNEIAFNQTDMLPNMRDMQYTSSCGTEVVDQILYKTSLFSDQ